MNDLFPLIEGLVLAFFLFLVGRSWYLAQVNKRLLQQDFIEQDEPSEEVAAFIEAIFPGHGLLPPSYRGKGEGGWDMESWLLTVSMLAQDDAPLTLLTWRGGEHLPDFALISTRGIAKTTGLLAAMSRVGKQWQHIGLMPLPDAQQPFLSSRRGLLLYAAPGDDPAAFLPPSIFESLRSSRTKVSLLHLGERIACWTQYERADELLRIGEAVKAEMPARPF